MPEGVTAAQSQLLFNIKKDGTYKVRFVARGDLTTEGVHYLESKSSMAHIESVRMLLGRAPETNPHMYMQLPRLPPELQGADLGRGAGSGFVAHMHRSIYGLKQAGRVWQQHLMKWVI